MSRSAPIVFLLLVTGALSASPVFAEDLELIEFEIADQFGDVHTREELRGRIALVFVSDKNGSRFGGAWFDALRAAVGSEPDSESIAFVDVADLRGVPFFVKGSVRKKFPRDPNHRVLLDWRGEFAESHRLAKHVCNILLVDAYGRVVRRTEQTDLDPRLVDELVREIRRLEASPGE